MQQKLSDDLLIGAEDIAEFMLGDRTKRRRIYHLQETGQIPLFYMGKQLAGRRSTLRKFIEEQDQAGLERVKRATALA